VKQPWKYAISEVTTINNTFEEDAALYASVGAGAMGVWGFKMEALGPARAVEVLDRHGLAVANSIPDLNSIMPYVLSPEPTDPMQRVEAFLPNLERMAQLQPESVVVITGPLGNYSKEEAFDLCVRGFKRMAQVADGLGVNLSFEPIHRSQADVFTFIWDIPGALEMIRAVDHPRFRLLFDTWHLWDTENVEDHIRQNIDLIAGVHVADWRKPTRTWADRAFPGEGEIPMRQLLTTLYDAGFRGHFDVELFSDDGRYSADYADSIWKLQPEVIVDRATRLFRSE
jgi:sugar phosphate isomerase/epimerase